MLPGNKEFVMATGQMNRVIRQVRRSALLREGGGLTDGQLLECFLTRREEAAFEALVQRHGPMVLGVCRRVLRNAHDAEDAFQSTFLVLVRKAASLLPRETIGNWLYGVAYHAALKARAATLKRQAKESQVRDMSKREAVAQDTWPDLQPLLDRELHRLPDKYREPVVLCELEGRTRKEVARRLGIPEGTLSSRLATARRTLAKRLGRHGLAISGGAVAVLLSENAALALMPTSLVVSTVKAATLIAAGRTVATGVISAKVATLTEGVLKTMWLTKLKTATAVLLVVALVYAGIGAFTHPALGQRQPDNAAGTPKETRAKEQAQAKEAGLRSYVEELPWVLTKVDAGKETISVALVRSHHGVDSYLSDLEGYHKFRALEAWHTLQSVSFGNLALHDFVVAKDAKFLIDGKECTLKDMKTGIRVSLRLAEGKAVISRIEAASPEHATLKVADVEKNTITVTLGGKDLTLPLVFDTKIFFAGGGNEGQFADLKVGMRLDLQLGAQGEKIVVKTIRAYK